MPYPQPTIVPDLKFNGPQTLIMAIMSFSVPARCQLVEQYNPPRMKMTESHPPGDILKLNDWMEGHAARVNAFYADYFSALVDEQGWLKANCSADGIHPNAEGYKVMAPIVEAAIQKALP